MKTTTTEAYEHRVKADYVDKDGFLFKAGEVLKRTPTPYKRQWYTKGPNKTYFDQGAIPAEFVAVFKITRTVTETEEAI
jgi:hypothetical protein